jgi:hypothetical protein
MEFLHLPFILHRRGLVEDFVRRWLTSASSSIQPEIRSTLAHWPVSQDLDPFLQEVSS